jgi:hypothetical protein
MVKPPHPRLLSPHGGEGKPKTKDIRWGEKNRNQWFRPEAKPHKFCYADFTQYVLHFLTREDSRRGLQPPETMKRRRPADQLLSVRKFQK